MTPRQARLHGRMNGEHVAQLEAIQAREEDTGLRLDVRDMNGERLAWWKAYVVRIDGDEVTMQIVIEPPETKATIAEIVGAR